MQPANKVEPCKLPTTSDQLDRSNFVAYWDGECRNGYAFGLGRDIAISDTHHAEEITIHSGTAANWSRPRVQYDFVNNIVAYIVGGAAFPARTAMMEKMDSSISGFNIMQILTVADGLGKEYTVQSSPFHPQRNFILSEGYNALAFRFSDATAVPASNPNAPTFAIEVIDPKSPATGGMRVARYANGVVQHFKVVDGKAELVSLPSEYTEHLKSKYREILTHISRAGSDLQRAQQIEREYLFKACNGKGAVEGLDNSQYTAICTWRDQFKAPYAEASEKYRRQLETLKQQAATAEQQRLAQEQIAIQQYMLQQQRAQQNWNMLNQGNQQLQQQNQQTLQGIQNWQPPQVQPITPPGGNRVVCNRIGSITTCR